MGAWLLRGPAPGYLAVDQDFSGDDDTRPNDDELVGEYGRPAGARDRRAIVAVVERYYAIALAGNAIRVCSMIVPGMTKHPGRVRTVPENRFRHGGPRIVAGESCVRVALRLFKRNHARVKAEVATLQVLAVRVHGRHGVELVGSRTEPERWMPLTREHGAWRIASLVDQELP